MARQILETPIAEINTAINNIGLGDSLYATQFGHAVFIASCHVIAKKTGKEAIDAQEKLLYLLDGDGKSTAQTALVQALLQPWIKEKPPKKLRKDISALLLDIIGDPRIQRARWEAIKREIANDKGHDLADQIVQAFIRWLTDVSMREFFRAISVTTDRKDQWKQRERFWLAYLDAGHILDAWPVLGDRAERQINQIIRESGERSDYAKKGDGNKTSSAIIMRIADLYIVEWSDNGACRIWHDGDKNRPELYRKKYYDEKLRAMRGGNGFNNFRHDESGAWKSKIARHIYTYTNIKHPEHGIGFE